MAFVVYATDNFNRNESPLGAASGWTTQSGESGWDCALGAGSVGRPINDADDCTAVYTGRTWLDNQTSRAKIFAASTLPGGGNGIGVTVRAASASRNKYRLVIVDGGSPGTNAVELSRFDPSYTMLQQYTVVYVSGAVLELQVTGTGTATVLTVIYNGVTLGTYADNGGSALSGGSPGLSYSGILVGCSLDDWEGLSEAVTSGYVNSKPINYLSGNHAVADIPLGTVDGDQLLAAIHANNTVTITPPAGWVEVDKNLTISSAGAAWLFRKVASGEGSTATFTLSDTSYDGQIALITYRGVVFDQEDGQKSATNSTSPETPALTPSSDNAILVGAFVCTQTGMDSAVPDTSPVAVERVDHLQQGTPNYSFIYIEDYAQATAASVSLGCVANGNSQNDWYAMLVSLISEIETSTASFDFGIAGYGAC